MLGSRDAMRAFGLILLLALSMVENFVLSFVGFAI